jgi:Ala-tRNA(Pro) deacylase
MTELHHELKTTLTKLEIEYRHFTHPAVYSTADIVLLPEKLPGVDTKNLFLRDEKRTRFILVCVRAETRVNLKDLGRSLGIKGTTFASPEDMLQMLNLTPGSVCLFGLMNDREGRVEGYLDASIPHDAEMQNHPLVNTATVVLKVADIERFCESVQHPLRRIEIPVRA